MSDKFEIRDGFFYSKDHEWAAVHPEGIAVGITAFALDQLGDITLINFDVKVGDTVTAGQSFGMVESVKTLSELAAPMAGRIVKINGEVEAQPLLVSNDCYGKGWMILILPTDASDKDKLLSPAAYRDFLKTVVQ